MKEKMNKKCLYCYQELNNETQVEFHVRCSKTFFGTKEVPLLTYSFDQMAELAKQVVERSVAVPGVQPKLSLTLINETLEKGNRGRFTVVGAHGGNFILKPPTKHYPEMPQNEHLTMRIAESFGIKTAQSSLIRLESGELSYITKRIDRSENGRKIHMLDMFQILEATDKYKGSMEKVGKAIGEYSSNTLLDKLNFFELSVFCFLTGNNDMHLKNFSMIKSGTDWLLAPAYDLLNATIANPEDEEEFALTLDAKKRKLRRSHFESLGKVLGLNEKQIEGVFKRAIGNKSTAMEWIENSFLTDEYKERYRHLLEQRYVLISL
jgi:serine/threonine-protein kinase HipA